MNQEMYDELIAKDEVRKLDDNRRYFFGFPETGGYLSFQYTHSKESNSTGLKGNDFLNVYFIKGAVGGIVQEHEIAINLDENVIELLANHESNEYAVLFTLELSSDKSAINVSATGYEESETRLDEILPENILI